MTPTCSERRGSHKQRSAPFGPNSFLGAADGLEFAQDGRARDDVGTGEPRIGFFKTRVIGLSMKPRSIVGEMAALHNETSAGLAPHLRIAHLLWWTAASAMGFAAYDGITPKRFLRDRADFFVVYDSVMGLVLGTILTGAGIMAYRRWCGGMPYPFLPGQWLLILGLAGDLANGVAIGAFDFLIRLYDPRSKRAPDTDYPVLFIQFNISREPYLIGVYHQAIGWGIGAAAALALTWHLRRRLSRPWLSVFLAFGLAVATLSAGHVHSLIRVHYSASLRPIDFWCRHSAHIYAMFVLLGTSVMLAAVAWDVRSRARVDGLHWTGVATWLVIAALQYATYWLAF